MNELSLKSTIRNGFVFQALISSVPSVLVLSAIPLINGRLKFSVVSLGTIFLLSRIGAIIGGALTPYLIQKENRPHVLCATSEVLNLVCSSVILLSIYRAYSLLFTFMMLLKGLATGVLGNIRFSWLRQFKDIDHSNRILLVITTLVQSAYGLGGVILIFKPDASIVEDLVILDILSSVIGFIIFLGMSSLKTRIINSQPQLNLFRIPFRNNSRRNLFIIDILVAMGMGGTNILLVKYGDQFFKAWGGYGISLLLYSVFYSIGGSLLHSQQRNITTIAAILKNNSLYILLMGFVLMLLSDLSKYFAILGFSVIFFIYPIVLLHIQMKWFELSSPENASQVFAYRTFFVSVMWAVGELFYSTSNTQSDILCRFLFLILAAFVFLKYKTSSKYHSVQHD